MTTPSYLRAQSGSTLLSVRLQPRASMTQVGEPMGGELRVRVTAAPVDAAANEALVRLLARLLDCGRNRVELVRGQASRHKVIKLHGFSPEEVAARLVPDPACDKADPPTGPTP